MAQKVVIMLFLMLPTTISAIPSICAASDFAGTLRTGGHIGYSAAYFDNKTRPDVFAGAAFGVQVVWGVTETVGLSLEGAFDLHRRYRERRKEEVTDDEGKLSLDWVPSAEVKHYFASTAALSFIYVLDITRVVPYFALGPSGIRVDRTADGKHDATYGFGVRAVFGFDFSFKRSLIGLGIASDSYLAGNTDNKQRLLFFIRVASIFHI